jgi:hypothetical protein
VLERELPSCWLDPAPFLNSDSFLTQLLVLRKPWQITDTCLSSHPPQVCGSHDLAVAGIPKLSALIQSCLQTCVSLQQNPHWLCCMAHKCINFHTWLLDICAVIISNKFHFSDINPLGPSVEPIFFSNGDCRLRGQSVWVRSLYIIYVALAILYNLSGLNFPICIMGTVWYLSGV